MRFEWDAEKARANLRQHGVSFVEAATVFGDTLSDTFFDPDPSATEDRCITIGVSRSGFLLVVAHAERGEQVRIISARKATRTERSYYEDKK